MRIVKRIAKIILDAPKREKNKEILPKGYQIFHGILSPEQVELLNAAYDPSNHDSIMSSGDNEIRWTFNDTETLLSLLAGSRINEIMKSYKSSEPNPAFIMRNHILSAGKIGSGGGWHRDTFSPALKIFIPLSLVDETNGAMQYCDTSLSHTSFMKSAVTGLRANNVGSQSDVLILRPGDVVVADVSALHRGGPVSKPGRDMLTVYFKDAR